MWHASISPRFALESVKRSATLFDEAIAQLAGVGDATLGEWREEGSQAVHLRRRLTDAEAAKVGPVCDVRGTADARERIRRMRQFLPPAFAAMPDEAFP